MAWARGPRIGPAERRPEAPRQQPGSRGSTPTRRARKTLYPTFYFLRQAVRSRCWVCKSRASPAPPRPGISTGLPAIKSPRGQRGQRNSIVLYGSRPSGPSGPSGPPAGEPPIPPPVRLPDALPWPSPQRPQPRPCRSQTPDSQSGRATGTAGLALACARAGGAYLVTLGSCAARRPASGSRE